MNRFMRILLLSVACLTGVSQVQAVNSLEASNRLTYAMFTNVGLAGALGTTYLAEITIRLMNKFGYTVKAPAVAGIKNGLEGAYFFSIACYLLALKLEQNNNTAYPRKINSKNLR